MKGKTVKQMAFDEFWAACKEYRRVLRTGEKESFVAASLRVHVAKSGVPRRHHKLVSQIFREETDRRALRQLTNRARAVCRRRGHNMAPFEFNDELGMSYSACKVCRNWVQCIVKPVPNQIDIGGPAVALDCS